MPIISIPTFSLSSNYLAPFITGSMSKLKVDILHKNFWDTILFTIANKNTNFFLNFTDLNPGTCHHGTNKNNAYDFNDGTQILTKIEVKLPKNEDLLFLRKIADRLCD